MTKSASPGLSRRSIILSGLAAAVLERRASAEEKPPAPLTTSPQPEPTKPRALSVSQQLEHVTVLLKTEDDKKQQLTGTGFFYTFLEKTTAVLSRS
jgi:hypothetical protein